MSGNRYATILIPLLTLALGGCVALSPKPAGSGKVRDVPNEDEMIIKALYYGQEGKPLQAYEWYERLYKATDKPEYRLAALRALLAAKRYDEALRQAQASLVRYPDDVAIRKIECLSLLHLKRVDDALSCAREVLKREPDNFQNVDLLASIYLLQGKNEEAYRVYADYYKKHHDDATVLKMASIRLHRFKEPEKALRLLESHSKMIG